MFEFNPTANANEIALTKTVAKKANLKVNQYD
jgi:hypothetical protein